MRLEYDILLVDIFPLSDLGNPPDRLEAWNIDVTVVDHTDQWVCQPTIILENALLLDFFQFMAV